MKTKSLPMFCAAVLAVGFSLTPLCAYAAETPSDSIPFHFSAPPHMETWDQSDRQDLTISGNNMQYMYGVNAALRNPVAHDWGRSIRPYNSESPVAYMWLDGEYMKRTGIVAEDGTIIAGDRITFTLLEPPAPDTSLGKVRFTLLEDDDSVKFVRDVTVLLIPLPSQCNLTHSKPWHISEANADIGTVSMYTCNGVHLTTFYSTFYFRDVFKIWVFPGGHRFAAIALDTEQWVMAEAADTPPYVHYDPLRSKSVTLQLYREPTLFTRDVPFPR